MRSPYLIWKKKFIARHKCAEDEFLSIIFYIAIRHVVSIVILCSFVMAGTCVFRYLDEDIAKEPFYEALMFSYTTITTIGYGKIVPKNFASRAFCVLFCIFGIPMVFLTLSNVGDFIAEVYWACKGALMHTKRIDEFEEKSQLPLKVGWTLIILHSLIGGLIFHTWIDEMSLISAIYFSFISITTIGYGDLNPTPDNGYHTTVLIVYLSVGITIMSTLFGALSGHIRQYSKNLYGGNNTFAHNSANLKNLSLQSEEWNESVKNATHEPLESQNVCAKSCSVNKYLCYKV